MAQSDVREYSAQAASTDTFGRVLTSARNHHFVVDGPVQNGCPGEAMTPQTRHEDCKAGGMEPQRASPLTLPIPGSPHVM